MEPAQASAIVVGDAPLAAAAAISVASVGLGRIGLAAGPAAEPAAAKLGTLVPETVVEPYPVTPAPENAGAIVAGADVVVECSSDAERQQTMGEACVAAGVPLCAGAVGGDRGAVVSVAPGTACLRCAGLSPSGEESPLAGGVAGVIGSLLALEALKLVSGEGAPLLDRVLRFDGRDGSQEIEALERKRDCVTCGAAAPAPQSP